MAAERRVKKGLSHWPCESGFFEDIKIRKLIRYQGGKAPLVYICLLCDIYREYGYYMKWNDELPFVVSEKLGSGYDEGYVLEVIKTCVTLGLFDAGLYEQGVLTSVAIQERFTKICQNAKRKYGIEEYNLISGITSEKFGVQDKSSEYKASATEDNNEENRIEENISPPISNEIVPPLENSEDKNVQETVPAKALSIEERKHQFGLELVPFVEKYGQQMIRDFFNYWTEYNEGGRKMKWEITKAKGGTFNIAGRLATWKRNEDEKFGGRRTVKRGSSIAEAVIATVMPEVGVEGTLDITKLLKQ